jgi:capsular polysaccharide biosynthesis protein
MDLWDLTRLLFRRWYFALPILLASVLTAALVSQSVKPDYRATGNVLIVPAPGPPTTAADPKPGDKTRPKNPWVALGFDALGNAAILKVIDHNSLESLKAAGLSASVTVQFGERAPILVIEAIGQSPAQATATVQQVTKLLVAEIEAQQRRFAVLPEDTITTLTLTDGSDVQEVTSKMKRVLIVTFGMGLLLTAAGTISLDALIRRRHRRRPTGKRAMDRAAVPGDDFDETSVPLGRSPIRPPLTPPRHAGDGADVTSRLPMSRVTSTDRGLEYAGTRGAGRRSAEAIAPVDDGGMSSDAPISPAPGSDATVILPLPRTEWSRREHRNGGR